jgi:TatD DNase family protein
VDNFDFLTDSHCHLDDEKFAKDFDDVLARARSAGVGRIIAVGTLEGIEGARRVLQIARDHDWIRGVAGLHPHEARLLDDDLLERLEEIARQPEIVAVGETGLDFHYDFSPRENQRSAFRELLRMARRVGKPVVIHTREAAEETLGILDEEKGWELGGVVHCFSGSLDMAREVLSKGFYISFTGVITFPHAHKVRDVLAAVPTERVLIETDAPYLAPVPHRGKRNEPAHVRLVAAEYARVRNLSEEDVRRITSLNAARLFGLPSRLPARIAYTIRGSLYLNITNRCTLGCRFCPKRKDWMVKGHYLRLGEEPSVERIMEEVRGRDVRSFDEVVFCGFGEPTLRMEALVELARRLREEGARSVRLDTDGLGSLVSGRSIIEELASCIDVVCVSLNAPDAATYRSICPSEYGEKAYEAVKEFIRSARGRFRHVIATVVGMPGIDVEKCRRVAEEELGVSFRVREYNEVG